MHRLFTIHALSQNYYDVPSYYIEMIKLVQEYVIYKTCKLDHTFAEYYISTMFAEHKKFPVSGTINVFGPDLMSFYASNSNYRKRSGWNAVPSLNQLKIYKQMEMF
jgi:hypothetical protein